VEERVNMIDNQRVDKSDLPDIGNLPLNYTKRLLGALMGGQGGGCLSPFGTDVNALAKLVLIGPFAFYWAEKGVNDLSGAGSVTWGGEIVEHDPLSNKNDPLDSQIDYSAAHTAATTAIIDNVVPPGTADAFPYLWVQPWSVAEDHATRRYWDTVSGSEDGKLVWTRQRRRVRFILADAAPVDSTTWAPVGRVIEWQGTVPGNAGDPLIMPFSVWDRAAFPLDSDAPAPDATHTSRVSNSLFGLVGTADSEDLGLVRLLQKIRKQLWRINDDTDDWDAIPASDIKTLDAAKTDHEARIAHLETHPYMMLGAVQATWDGATYQIVSEINNVPGSIATFTVTPNVMFGGTPWTVIDFSPVMFVDNKAFFQIADVSGFTGAVITVVVDKVQTGPGSWRVRVTVGGVDQTPDFIFTLFGE